MCLGSAKGITVKNGAVYRNDVLIHKSMFAVLVALYIVIKEA